MKQLRENAKDLDGNTIEMEGEVPGIMTRDDGRMALLKVSKMADCLRRWSSNQKICCAPELLCVY